MKRFVKRAKRITKKLASGLRNAVEPSLAQDSEPLEIRSAIVEHVEAQVQAIGGGRRVLATGPLRVRVLAPTKGAEVTLRATLDDISTVVVTRLHEMRCEFAPDWHIETVYVKRRPNGWAKNQSMAFEGVTKPIVPAAAPTIELMVLRGSTAQPSYAFTRSVVRIGRSSTPTDDRGRPRNNDIAFLEDEDEVNRTVTRGHCTIRLSETEGRFRVFDDGSSNGTRLLRNGDSIEVYPRDPIGVVLRSGDQLQLGQALLSVTIAGL